jgi:hypothetical protein
VAFERSVDESSADLDREPGRKLAVAGIGRVTRDARCERRRIREATGRGERIWHVAIAWGD